MSADVIDPSHVIIKVQVSPTIYTRRKFRCEYVGKQLQQSTDVIVKRRTLNYCLFPNRAISASSWVYSFSSWNSGLRPDTAVAEQMRFMGQPLTPNAMAPQILRLLCRRRSRRNLLNAEVCECNRLMRELKRWHDRMMNRTIKIGRLQAREYWEKFGDRRRNKTDSLIRILRSIN